MFNCLFFGDAGRPNDLPPPPTGGAPTSHKRRSYNKLGKMKVKLKRKGDGEASTTPRGGGEPQPQQEEGEGV